MKREQDGTHTFSTKVYLEDVDQGGIVYHANYLKYAERARTEMLAEGGVRHADMLAQGVGIVVSKLSVRYLRPLRLEETLVVSTRINNIASASAQLEQRIFCNDVLMAVLMVELVNLGPLGRPTRWTDALKQALSGTPSASGLLDQEDC